MKQCEISNVIRIVAHLADVTDIEGFVTKHEKFVEQIVTTMPLSGSTLSSGPAWANPAGGLPWAIRHEWSDSYAQEVRSHLTPLQLLILQHINASGNRSTKKDVDQLLLTKGGYKSLTRTTVAGIFSGLSRKCKRDGVARVHDWDEQQGKWYYVMTPEAYPYLKKYL
jgi:hypothetical protein